VVTPGRLARPARQDGDVRVRPVVIAAAATLVLGVALVAAVDATRAALDAMAPATCLPDACFCEAVRPEGLAQPVNALTSLAYVLLGLWSLIGGVRRPDHTPTARLMVAVGVVLVALGLGSFAYHASLTFVGQVLDVQGMYLLGALVLVGALVRRGALAPRSAPWVYLTAVVLLLVVQVVWPESRRLLFGLVLLPGVVLEALPGTTGVPWRSQALRPFRVGLLLLAVAYALWLLDDAGVLCAPTSVWQGHGAWHVLTAVAAVLVVVHYARTVRSGLKDFS
jgi:dihydroceramidase